MEEDTRVKQSSKKKKKVLFTRILVYTLAGILLLTVGFATYAFIRIQGMKTNEIPIVAKPTAAYTAPPEPTLVPIEGTPEDIGDDIDDDVDPGDIDDDPIYEEKPINKGITNILIIGEDIREGENGRGRSDTMMVLSYNRKTNTARMVSLLRDTYVYIPGRTSWNRINTAYRFGGIGLTINTINANFGLDIQYYISTNFENLKKIVDTLGGLSLHLTEKEAGYIIDRSSSADFERKEGTYVLNGTQVLLHSRNRRMGDGDWGRVRRQRDVMEAFLARAKKEKSVATLTALADTLLQYVKTNMDATQLVQMGIDVVFSEGFSYKTASLPFKGTWQYASVNGASVIKIDREANKKQLHDFLFS